MTNSAVKFIGSCVNGISYISPNLAANTALKLFTTPRKGKISAEQQTFLDTSQQLLLNHNGHNIMTYHWSGNNKTVLLAHGWESNSGRWQITIEELRKLDYNIIALDAPAHGQSGSDIFNAILYADFIHVASQHFSPEIIIGHSVGGMATGYHLFKYRPKLISKLILLGAPSEFKDVLKRYTDMLGYNNRVIDELNNTIVNRFGTSPEKFATSHCLKDFPIPTLVIHDKEDDIIPYQDALQIADSHNQCQLNTTKGLGHSLNTLQIIETIKSFIKD
ncbi:alpha/beta fold hydrolase [Mangrovimonas aestuarii]|uniref:alpha/beta fold hydrolase n=1 Tax=Mangrovimonas aestuarii TaxID=3018443 RepID=UPI00237952B3|nr:alpha/beta hydrolase [Mangrovimonas aestuarii]